MPIILQLLLVFTLKLFSVEFDFSNPSDEDTKKIEAPKAKIELKKEKGFENLGYGYRTNSSDVKSDFTGKAYYKMPVDQNEDSSAYITAGAKVHRSSMKIKELSFENRQHASAQIGFNRDFDTKENPKSIKLEVAQPVYDNKNKRSPTVEMSYDVKF